MDVKAIPSIRQCKREYTPIVSGSLRKSVSPNIIPEPANAGSAGFIVRARPATAGARSSRSIGNADLGCSDGFLMSTDRSKKIDIYAKQRSMAHPLHKRHDIRNICSEGPCTLLETCPAEKGVKRVTPKTILPVWDAMDSRNPPSFKERSLEETNGVLARKVTELRKELERASNLNRDLALALQEKDERCKIHEAQKVNQLKATDAQAKIASLEQELQVSTEARLRLEETWTASLVECVRLNRHIEALGPERESNAALGEDIRTLHQQLVELREVTERSQVETQSALRAYGQEQARAALLEVDSSQIQAHAHASQTCMQNLVSTTHGILLDYTQGLYDLLNTMKDALIENDKELQKLKALNLDLMQKNKDRHRNSSEENGRLLEQLMDLERIQSQDQKMAAETKASIKLAWERVDQKQKVIENLNKELQTAKTNEKNLQRQLKELHIQRERANQRVPSSNACQAIQTENLGQFLSNEDWSDYIMMRNVYYQSLALDKQQTQDFTKLARDAVG